MGHHFVSADRSTPFLLPPSVQEWLPEDHLARFIVEIVEQLDLTPLERAYAGRGSKAYHPRMLLALLFYGYATGLFSSRKLEAATYDSIAFRFICANTHPDHDTIAAFRRRFLPQLEPLFTAILLVAAEMGVLKLGTVALDGSKMKANASKHKALSWGHAEKLEAQLQQEADELLALAEATDRDEEQALIDIPEELARRQERLEAIRAAKAKIEARAQQRYEAEQAAHDEKMQKRRAKEEATGKKTPGTPPKPPEPGPRQKDQVNLTDEESRIMPVSGGGFEQAYNVQAAVDIETQLIVAQFATQAPNDRQQLAPALLRLEALPDALGRPEHLLADNGYFSQPNVDRVAEAGIEPLMALGREAHHQALTDLLTVPEAPAAEATALDVMAYRLKTPAGRALYGRRKSSVEPVFGQIKRVLGFRQFMLRGFDGICGEWTLVTMAYNLRRLFQLSRGPRGTAGSVSEGKVGGPVADAGGPLAARFSRWGAMAARRCHRVVAARLFIPQVA
jgi:transposase